MKTAWHPDSLVIDASAGYGKTETLCARLIALLLADPAAADEMVALTFTRAAAAEIYTRMLKLVVSAVRSEERAEELRERLRSVEPDVFDRTTRDDFMELLKLLVDKMGKLNISTIDSFFYRLVRVFAIELGLPGRAELAQGDEKTAASELVKELFSAPGDREFASACRDSRFGEENKRFFDTCMELVDTGGRHRSRRDDAEFWGGGFAAFSKIDAAELAAALEVCDRHCWGKADYQGKLRPVLLECAAAQSAEYRFGRRSQETLRCFFKVWARFPQEKPKGFSQNWDYFGPVVPALRTLLENARNVLLCQCARRTAALREITRKYCELYQERRLRRGIVAFSDLPQLLLEEPEDGEFLNEVQYRTNSRFRHFFIDEFQDTSRDQWRVLEPITADSGDNDHSLFLVGDVKQAIYGWRNGDSKLMGEVAKIIGRRERLGRSFRYGKDICRALNLLFGPAGIDFAALPGETIRRWNDIFSPHEPGSDKPGQFEVIALAPGYGSTAGEFAKISAKHIAGKLRSLDFFSRGLSGGVLVRSKKHGIMLRDELEKLGVPGSSIIWEGDESIANDPLVSSLLEFGVYIQHPGESMARGIVRMNQLLGDLLPADEDARQEWASLIVERGIAEFLLAALKKLRTRSIEWGKFRRDERRGSYDEAVVESLLALAAKFDASAEARDMLRFRSVAAEYRRPPADVTGKLRLLTIHHSKGLTFDVVFHPMFDPSHGNWRSPDPGGLLTGGGTPGAPAWALLRPREEGATNGEIAGAIAARHADECFEELCALYVALTRASRGMYVILPPRSKEKCRAYHPLWDTRVNFPGRCGFKSIRGGSYYVSDLVFEAFFSDDELFPVDDALETYVLGGVEYLVRSFGSPWMGEKRISSPRENKLAAAFAPAPKRPGRAAPSHLETGDSPLRFALPRPGSGELFGTQLHAFFERIGYWDEFVPPPDTDEAILEHYRACARNDRIVGLLSERCSALWRERSFDVMLDDGCGSRELVTGCFDRVQLYRGADGRLQRAVIVDYKSNQVTPGTIAETAEHYRKQMETYRRALAALLGETPNAIECRLVFTRPGEMLDV